MVVVIRAEDATICGFTSLAFSTKVFIGTSLPRSTTLKPAIFSIEATMSFPIEWISPSIVPMTMVPRLFVSDLRFSISGLITSMPAFIASAAASTCGRKREPCSNCSPTSCMPAVKPFSMSSTGSIPASRASAATSAAISSSNSVIAFFAFAMISSLLAIFRSPEYP